MTQMQNIETELIINEILPGLKRDVKTALLIDSNNLYRRAKDHDFHIDYVKLVQILSQRCDLDFKGVFSVVDRENESAVEWAEYMRSHGFKLHVRDLRRFNTPTGIEVEKRNTNVDLAVAALTLDPEIKHVIIGSCDSDFIPLITALQAKCITVSLLAFVIGSGESLLRTPDNFYNMANLAKFIKYRGVPR